MAGSYRQHALLLALVAFVVAGSLSIAGPVDTELGYTPGNQSERTPRRKEALDLLVAAATEFRVVLPEVRRTDVQSGSDHESTTPELDDLLDEFKRLLADGGPDEAIRQLRYRCEVSKDRNHTLMIKAIQKFALRSKLVSEFSLKPLVISGVFTDTPDFGVIINGECFEEGEYLDADTFVKDVRREEIVFGYKGFTLVKAL